MLPGLSAAGLSIFDDSRITNGRIISRITSSGITASRIIGSHGEHGITFFPANCLS
jgi:hypothetical protein